MTSQLFNQADLAGMVSASGALGEEQFLWKVMPPPHVRLNADRLEWWYDNWDPFDDKPPPPSRDTGPTGMLDAFVRIQTPEDVLRFAQRYGVLAICEHGLPATHNSPHAIVYPWPWYGGAAHNAYSSPKRPWCQDRGWALLSVWFAYVHLARAILSLGAALHQGKPGAVGDWVTVLQSWEGMPRSPLRFPTDYADENVPRDQLPLLAEVLAGKGQGRGGTVPGFAYYIHPKAPGRPYLASAVNMWLYVGNVRPGLIWAPGAPRAAGFSEEPTMRLSPGSSGCVYGALGVQLVAVVNRGHDIAVCSGCGHPYLREGRKPQAGRRNFCPDCGEQVANRIRQRKWRQRRGSAEGSQA